MAAVAVVEYVGVTVEDLKKTFVFESLHILGIDGKMKIGVVDVRKHRLPRDAALRQYRIDVALHHFGYAVAALDRDKTFDVGGVKVNGFAGIAGRYFFAGQNEETPCFLKKGHVFFEGFEPHAKGVSPPFFVDDPLGAVLVQVALEGTTALGSFGYPAPFFAVL